MENTNTPQQIYWEYFIPQLLLAWQAAGHSFGVEQHLQLRQLLQTVKANTPLAALKTLLAPIFVNNAESQVAFYEIFDKTLISTTTALQFHEENVAAILGKTLPQQFLQFAQHTKDAVVGQWWAFKNWQRLAFAAGLSIFLLALTSWGIYSNFFTSASHKYEITSTPKVFLPIKLSEEKANIACISNKKSDLGAPTKVSLASQTPKHLRIESTIKEQEVCFEYEGISAGREELTYNICFENGSCQNYELILLVDDFQQFTPVPQVIYGNITLDISSHSINEPTSKQASIATISAEADPKKLQNIRSTLDTTYFSTSPTQRIDGVTTRVRLGEGFAYFTFTKVLYLIALALVLFGIGWWIRRRRQRIFFGHQPNEAEPYTWTIRIPLLNEVDMGRTFQQTLTAMRLRNAIYSNRMDVRRTVEATIEQGGAIDIQYAQQTRQRQYLVLLDIASQENHQAKIFNLFIENLQQNEVPLERFFFNGDPHHCWNERHPKGVSLRHLEHIYQNYHLIVCGNCHHLLQEESGKLAPWTIAFNTWNRRLILTPRSIEEWDTREEALEKSFRLLPATPSGIAALVETLEATDSTTYRELTSKGKAEEKYSPIYISKKFQSEQLIALLEAEFIDWNGQPNETLLKWIAGCAIPSVLFWNWTLYVGQLLSTPTEHHLTFENLLQIARLPWFVKGQMPEDVRLTLVNWLEQNHPDWLVRLRQQWNNVLQLEDNLPPLGSLAWEGHRIEILVNELLQNPAWYRRRKLELELEQLIHGKREQDAFVIKYLEKKKGFLDNALFSQIRRYLQVQQGIIWRWRMWVWQLPILAVAFFGLLFVHYTEPVTTFQFDNYITDLSFSPDSRSFLSSSGRGKLAMCTVEGQWMQGVQEGNHQIIATATSADGTIIQAITNDNQAIYWDVAGAPIYIFNRKSRLVTSVAFHPLDPFQVLIGYYDNAAELWDIKTHTLLAAFSETTPVEAVAFSPDGQLILTGSQDYTAKLWSRKGVLLQTFKGHQNNILAVAFSPDGQYILTGSRDNTAKLWDLSGHLIRTFKGHSYNVLDVAFSPDGAKILTASGDDTAMLWATVTGKRLRTFRGHNNYVTSATFSPDGKYILTGDRTGKVKLWHFENGEN